MVGATIYIPCQPCDGCVRLISGAGIARIVWACITAQGQGRVALSLTASLADAA